ncbi:hypothetical protein C5167_018171 [Papaver somniferum]|uniref:Pentatricopeptide repeat-containing protein n=1 Tax=Papaver somniferum TaxID=3469 RepID=A0A4Y7IM00_PAPSO|nr:hypothetical protein C5167_018171 [Papaver somniferum]
MVLFDANFSDLVLTRRHSNSHTIIVKSKQRNMTITATLLIYLLTFSKNVVLTNKPKKFIQKSFILEKINLEPGFLDGANEVFHNIPIDCKSDFPLWNSILRASKIHGFDEETIHLYIQMRNSGVSSDGFTFPLVIKACTSMGDSKLCKAIHGHVLVSGYQFNLHGGNDLING